MAFRLIRRNPRDTDGSPMPWFNSARLLRDGKPIAVASYRRDSGAWRISTSLGQRPFGLPCAEVFYGSGPDRGQDAAIRRMLELVHAALRAGACDDWSASERLQFLRLSKRKAGA